MPYYNGVRMHSGLGYSSPADYEMRAHVIGSQCLQNRGKIPAGSHSLARPQVNAGVVKAAGPDNYTVLQNNGVLDGQTVFHARDGSTMVTLISNGSHRGNRSEHSQSEIRRAFVFSYRKVE